MKNRKIILLLLCSILLFIFMLDFLSIRGSSITTDEPMHFTYGKNILEGNSDRQVFASYIDDSKMPFSVLNAGAIRLVEIARRRPFQKDESDALPGRIATILFSLVLAFFVFRWTRDLYGIVPAFFSLFLYAFSPNIIAHSRLITTDLYAAAMATISLYYFWKFLNNPRGKTAFVSAITLGFAQLAKYTCLYLYPIFLVITVCRYAPQMLQAFKKGKLKQAIATSRTFLVYILLFIVVSLLIINMGYLFNGSFTPLKKYSFADETLKTLQSIPIINAVPLPLPVPYVQGLDMTKYFQESGQNAPLPYLFGRLITERGKDFHGFRLYYFWANLFKEPLPATIFFLLALITYLSLFKMGEFLKNELFLFAPLIFFFVYFNFAFNYQIGIRHFLIAMPLIIIFSGRLLKNWNNFSLPSKAAVIVLSVYLAASVLSSYPDFIAYFNELLPERRYAYKILSDSNLDFRQNQEEVIEYLRSHPEAIYEPEKPVAGEIVVSTNSLTGTTYPKKYQWLRENFQPSGHIKSNYLIYRVEKEDLEKIESFYY